MPFAAFGAHWARLFSEFARTTGLLFRHVRGFGVPLDVKNMRSEKGGRARFRRRFASCRTACHADPSAKRSSRWALMVRAAFVWA